MEINSIHSLHSIYSHPAIQPAQPARPEPESTAPQQPEKPSFYQEPDRYSPQDPEPPSGRYMVEPGEDGPKIRFDGEGKPVSMTTTNTDDVDREIQQLRKKVEDLQKQLSQSDGPERQRIEKSLKAAQQELSRKDNDGYRRANAKIS